MSAASKAPARFGAALTATGIHAGLALTVPWAALALTVLEAALGATVILTALYAPESLSRRAFRLLPWTAIPSVGTDRQDNQPASSQIAPPPQVNDEQQ
jgi:hypothetical protein